MIRGHLGERLLSYDGKHNLESTRGVVTFNFKKSLCLEYIDEVFLKHHSTC